MDRLVPPPLTVVMTTDTTPAAQPDQPVLVVGGTGKTGRRVAQRLRDRGIPVRIGSRGGKPPFDWTDPTTWPAALAGVRSVYLTYQPDLVFPGAAERIAAVAELAARSGVDRIVLLSGRGEPAARVSEQGVHQAGATWTVIRSSLLAQNFSEAFLLEPVLAGVVALPAGDVKEPFVDAEDIADVAVAALTEDGHAGRTYELTGPRLLTLADAADEIAAASGRPVRYLPVSVDGYTAELVATGMPEDEAVLFTELFSGVFDGRNAFLTDDVERVTGHRPRDFRTYAEQAAATGVWNGA